jgi:hypothetical protein
MLRFSVVAASVTGSLLLTLAACGGGSDKPSEAAIQKELSGILQKDGLTEEQSDCTSKIIIDEVGLTKLQGVDLTAPEPPPEIEKDLAAAAKRAATECDLEPATTSTTN